MSKKQKIKVAIDKSKIPVCFASLSEASQRSWTIPEFYKDEIINCVDCGKEILFKAEQQKEWYEIKKRYFFQKPIRCPEHHEKWRKARKSKFHMDHALEALKKNPESINTLKEYALAIVDFHKETGRGDIRTGLHILKKYKDEEEALNYCKKAIKDS